MPLHTETLQAPAATMARAAEDEAPIAEAEAPPQKLKQTDWLSPFESPYEDELDVPTFLRKTKEEEDDRELPAFLRRSAD